MQEKPQLSMYGGQRNTTKLPLTNRYTPGGAPQNTVIEKYGGAKSRRVLGGVFRVTLHDEATPRQKSPSTNPAFRPVVSLWTPHHHHPPSPPAHSISNHQPPIITILSSPSDNNPPLSSFPPLLSLLFFSQSVSFRLRTLLLVMSYIWGN
jgi:hypothetical protein